ncbi:MAG: thiamine-phosphate kinase [Gammaproteobacteria bacterium]|jgi:thiamine-monophosphate kinase|nr:thiamine-phosphate kinase [Gammaproteobacteria bacterium]MBT4495048.1 thiamine-phosphate kinase [Gammaproteobacteria bacterium]MBT7371342.1 thiamine-phosphate kinase [Gammaproteobacteria bacterium]
MKEHEFAVIEHYFKSIASSAEGVDLGPGDDCAILTFAADRETCVSTDTLVESVHFPAGCPPSVVAARTLGANLSDLAAMGAEPHSFLLAVTLPEIDQNWLAQFSEALAVLIDRYKVPLVGGNLSKGSLSLTVTIIGQTPRGEAVRRDGAQAGDDIYVTGTLGDAARGLELVRSGDYTGYLASRYCEPIPRIEAGVALRDFASSMIDLSDGLMADLGHICEASQLGAVVETKALPLSPQLLETTKQESAVRMALYSGDDYELCFTVHPDKTQQMLAALKEIGMTATRIGQMRRDPKVLAVDVDGKPIKHGGSGYQHF